MARELSEREIWLRSKIGSKVYRPKNLCTCDPCKEVYENGVDIPDIYHADYLSEMEAIYSKEGIPMKYFETREEALEFEKKNPPTKH